MKTRNSAKLALLLVFVSTTALHARDFRVAEVFGAYSLLHGDLQKHASGWEISGGGYFTHGYQNQWLSLHVDFDAHHQSSAGSQRHQHDFLFGPQFSHRTSHFTVFAHTLAGVSHISGSTGTHTGFGYVAGSGIDWDYNPAIAFRLAQVDYHTAHLFGAFQHQARFSFGIVFHLIGWVDPAPRIPPPPNQKPPETAPTHSPVSAWRIPSVTD